jgi:multiple sugar transport system permease protein
MVAGLEEISEGELLIGGQRVNDGIATTAILCLVFSWNDYAFAVTFSGPDSQTLPIAASQLVTQTSIDWGQLTAIGTIVVAPMILVGLIVRKWLVTGLTLGAVTGE